MEGSLKPLYRKSHSNIVSQILAISSNSYLDKIVSDGLLNSYYLIPDLLVFLPPYILKTEMQSYIISNTSQMSFLDYKKHNLERLIENEIRFIGINFESKIFSKKNRLNLLKYIRVTL